MMIEIVYADTWEYTLFIRDTLNNTDPTDDVDLSSHMIVVDEGSTGTFFGGSNSGIENLSINHTYFIFIKGNTTEGDYNYDADSVFDTYIASTKFTNSISDVPWNGASGDGSAVANPQYTITGPGNGTRNGTPPDSVPFDTGAIDRYPDVLFWSTVFDASMDTEEEADVINYNDDNNILERAFVQNAPFVDGSSIVSYTGTEQTSGDTDPEGVGFTGWSSRPMTTGEYYYWGVIFTVDADWEVDDSDVNIFHHAGEAGDNDQEINWNWTINQTSAAVAAPPSNTCSPTTPLTADHTFDANDNCVISSPFDAGGFNIECRNIAGTGTLSWTAEFTNYNYILTDIGCRDICEKDLVSC